MRINKVWISIGIGMFLTGCHGSDGSGPAAQNIPSTVEPKFEVIRQIDPESDYAMGQHCSNKYSVDPRLRAGHVFTEVTEGLNQRTQTPYSELSEKTIQTASPEQLSYNETISTRGFTIQATFNQKCSQNDNGWKCSEPDFKVINPPPGMNIRWVIFA